MPALTEKQHIQQSFSRAKATYDDACQIQEIVCDALFSHLKSVRSDYGLALGLGTGTGKCVSKLLELCSVNACMAVDISLSLLERSRYRVPAYVQQVLADFDTPICQDTSMDLIFSSMGLQWSLDIKKVFDWVYTALQPGGIFTFSVPLKNTFSELNPKYSKPLASAQDIFQQLSDRKFVMHEVFQQSYQQHFASPYAALRSVKDVGANARCDALHAPYGLSRKFIESVFKPADTYALTYHIGFFILERPEK